MKRIATIVTVATLLSSVASQAGQAKPAAQAPAAAQPAQPPAGVTPPDDYVIGAGDILIITFWEEPQMSTPDAVVRPDGMITLPLLNDVPAKGLRTDQLRDRLTELAKKVELLKDPRVSVAVRAINSRIVYIVGRVQKPGPYPLLGPLDVISLLALAGGPLDYADTKKIRILRDEGGKQRSMLFNYSEVEQGKKLEQNISLKPGDRVIVPE